ncbi:chemotaxis protein CheX [Nocardioides sp. SOB77]|uniref:Chemotaxis protein CheX n=1 Tax=Nocardioides oceani TaxID=3058369 RepID=A0ABT8FFV4_9ACTN|nr:chemotaxis protein CheX [Nocardioides oceani]MDN4173568.1 chemotaxis protein CheX [Nocardioides oceani]
MSILAPSALDLEALVTDMWASFVGAPELLLPAGPPADDAVLWSATVTVTGEWRGMVSVDLAEAAVLGVTRGMLGFGDDEEPDAASCTDAVGELVNVVGGNVKSLMPGPSTLSLPVVSRGAVEVPSEMEEASVLHLTWCEAPVRVRVLTTTTSS